MDGARPAATDTGAWAGLLALLDAALDLPDAPSRDAWIERQGLPPDTADALRRLLADHARLQSAGFLEPLTAASVPAAPADDADDTPPQVGPWRLLRPLGEGGIGRVWLAERDDGQMRRQVALKLPHAGPGQAALAARLLRERQLLASLEHPHIARLYDVGLTADGRPYLVMQYVDGEPITTACDRRRLSIDQRLAVFGQALQAVQHAHQRLVLHRDLKPSNILLDAAGQVSLLDFGVARPLGEAVAAGPAEASPLTGLHGAPLTPGYAAPEQLAGEPLTTGCDVYALGVVLHELLTGRRPHRLPVADLPALARWLRAAPPARPSDAAFGDTDAVERAAARASTPARLRQRLRGDLDAIVATALAADPARRYATVQEFADDLARHAAREPVAARAPGPGLRALRFVQRHRLPVAAAAAVTISLSAGLGVAAWQLHEARAQAARAEAIRGFLVSLFASNRLDQADAGARRRETVGALLERSTLALVDGLDGAPATRTDLLGVAAQLLDDLALPDVALRARQAQVAGLQTAGAPPAEQALALRALAATHLQRGDRGAAREALGRAIAATEGQDGAEAVLQRAQAEGALGLSEIYEGRTAFGAPRIESAAAALERLAPGTAMLADALAALAVLRHEQGRDADTGALLARALALREATLRHQPVALARVRRETALLGFDLLADSARAIDLLDRAAADLRRHAGDDDINVALIEQSAGRVLLTAEQFNAAQQRLARADAVLRAAATRLNPAVQVESALLLAQARLAAGRWGEARQAMSAARQALRDDPDPAPVWVRYANLLAADIDTATGRFDAALPALREALARDEAANGPNHVDTLEQTLRLASALQAAGQGREAAAQVDAALARGTPPEPMRDALLSLRASLWLDEADTTRALPLARSLHDRAVRRHAGQPQPGALAAAEYRLARALSAGGDAASALALYRQAADRLQTMLPEGDPAQAALLADWSIAAHRAGDRAGAQRLLARAQALLAREPEAGPQYRRVLDDARAVLATASP